MKPIKIRFKVQWENVCLALVRNITKHQYISQDKSVSNQLVKTFYYWAHVLDSLPSFFLNTPPDPLLLLSCIVRNGFFKQRKSTPHPPSHVSLPLPSPVPTPHPPQRQLPPTLLQLSKPPPPSFLRLWQIWFASRQTKLILGGSVGLGKPNTPKIEVSVAEKVWSGRFLTDNIIP